ncbi:NAD(P)H-dependent oxidoreductase [Mucilaginibacter mali]|uniref:NAD(P)H-dependent oxidoreductase n=1 Tax=Mucilaginibacter mali TaxID=2740462 RepID=A0A7D4UD29_9SPHI|nr:NAD(P)H-dependent oxidoreductase [Mucilaginibacter mali]QKJ30099.1 NAD(P)H-dependent oxidoreductase [Mucilaginibacter mali]
MSKTILAISGSLRDRSSNTQILKLIGTWLPADISYDIYDGMGDLPHFIPAAEDEAFPKAVQSLHNQLDEADAVIICTPEYAFGLPGSLKNLLDWTVATGNFVDKPVAVITASSQGSYAHPSLLTTLGALSANIVDDATLLIPFIRAKMDTNGNITDEATERELHTVIDNLLQAIT